MRGYVSAFHACVAIAWLSKKVLKNIETRDFERFNTEEKMRIKEGFK